ncbi:MAG: transglycosylase domain-containing protein [Gammaproteobacteria bacterium]|nr:transglycosylase domain-containing protein [Gammaproteobacteria bacterium]
MYKKIGLLIIFSFIGITIYSIVVVYQASNYTKDVVLKDLQNNEWRIYKGATQPISLEIGDLSKKQKDWLLSIQDPDFANHKGIDLSTPGAGMTTLTQSIVKKLYFEKFKPGIRKIKQSLIARFVVHNLLGKKEQIVLFVNSAYMGSFDGKPVFGFSKASEIYFGKSFSQLSDEEYLSLVAMLIGPDRFNVREAPQQHKERVSRIKEVIAGRYKPKDLTDVYYDRT